MKKEAKKYKYISIKLSTIIIGLIIIVISTNLIINFTNKGIKEEVKTISQNAIIVQRLLEDKSIPEDNINSNNSQYDTIGNKEIILLEYCGNEVSVVVPEKIQDNTIKEIDINAFKNCKNLEIIKISKKIADNIKKIEGFELNNSLSNEEFAIYNTTKEYTKEYLRYINLEKDKRDKVTVIPNKFKEMSNISNNYKTKGSLKSATADSLPTSYDLREHIQIDVENQDVYGTCYAYATLKSVETNINLELDSNITNNFSEIHAAVLSDQGYGGWFDYVVTEYFDNGYGPVNEISGTYLTNQTVSQRANAISQTIYNYCVQSEYTGTFSELNDAKTELLKYKPEYYVIGTKYFPYMDGDFKDNAQNASEIQFNRNLIKEHIINEGSVSAYIGAPIYPNIQTYNGKTVMCGGEDSACESAHVISLIGWDDNFEASYFPSSMGVTQDGAYLALNSWGDNWGDDGYFWISYQDYYVELFAAGVTNVTEGKVDLANARINVNSVTYNGYEKTPAIVVTYGEIQLVNGIDYIITDYINNINVGTATVRIEGIGRFQGTLQENFEITEKNINTCSLTLDNNSYIYDGNQKKPVATIKDGSKTLIEDTDYEISYANNINVGTATVTARGLGNYNGTVTETYSIISNEILINNTSKEETYNKEEHQFVVEVAYPSDYTIKYGEEEDSYTLNEPPKHINAGTYRIYYKITANGFEDKKGVAILEITPKDINETTIQLNTSTYTYSGEENRPEITIQDEGTQLIENNDYTITYNNNINVGTASAIIEGKGNYSGSDTKNFNIDKANPNYTVPTGIMGEKGKQLGEVQLPENFVWENSGILLDELGEHTFKCSYVPTDTNNYNTITGIDVIVTVAENLLNVNIEKYSTQKSENANIMYIKGIAPESTIEDIIDNVETNGTIKVYDNKGNEITQENQKAKTGMKIEISRNGEKIEYKLTVTGDLSGDGEVNGSDLLRLARFLVGLENNLTDEYLLAGNVKIDDDINANDLLRLARVLVGLDRII